MKALFLGGVAAGTAAGIRDRLPAGLEVEILDDPIDRARLRQAAADADILVSNHWRADYPPAPRVKLVQSVATGVELIELHSASSELEQAAAVAAKLEEIAADAGEAICDCLGWLIRGRRGWLATNCLASCRNK